MQLIIDIPDYCYEQIQEHPKGVWISKDMIKPLQAELEEIKAEMEDKLEPFILGERNLKKDALQILDNHIKKEG